MALCDVGTRPFHFYTPKNSIYKIEAENEASMRIFLTYRCIISEIHENIFWEVFSE